MSDYEEDYEYQEESYEDSPMEEEDDMAIDIENIFLEAEGRYVDLYLEL